MDAFTGDHSLPRGGPFLNYTHRWPQLMRPMSDSFISSSSRMAAIDATTNRRLRRYRQYQRAIEMRMVVIVMTTACPVQPASKVAVDATTFRVNYWSAGM